MPWCQMLRYFRDLQEYNLRFILGVKPGDHKFLFDYVDSLRRDKGGGKGKFNGIPGFPKNGLQIFNNVVFNH